MALFTGSQQTYYDGDDHGNYQFVSLTDVISQFMVVYVGEDKIINSVKRTDVAFHAQRALAELSFDTFKSCKSQEVTIPPSLQMILPHDYVNYTNISWVDSAGIKHRLQPTLGKTSNPKPLYQNSDGEYKLKISATLNSTNVNIELDGVYPNIARRMRVEGPSIPPGTYLFAHDENTAGDKTIIVLADINGVGFQSALDHTEVLQFSTVDGDLLNEQEDGISIFGTSTTTGFNGNAGENKITLDSSSTQDISGVKEGMGVFMFSGDVIPNNTVVTQVDTVNNVIFLSNELILPIANSDATFVGGETDSTTWLNYKSHTPSENVDYDYKIDDEIYDLNIGQRYGLDPSHSQINGSYYIDCNAGKIHFSSNISGKNVVLDYISDSLGTEDEMKVHKFAEEAMYKWIIHAVLSSKANTPEYIVARFKKERFAEIRKAKLRLSNIKLEEITQILRGKSKWIKH